MAYDIDLDLESKIAHMPGVIRAVHGKADQIGVKATTNLNVVRSTTTHVKFDQETAHETKIEVEHSVVDAWVVLDGPDALALEFGHDPSGVFGPGRTNRTRGDKRKGTFEKFQVMQQVGRYGHRPSKAPEGQYILFRAADLI